MDKTILYNKLNIVTADEFKYFENLSALLEEDDYIEENLVADLVKDVDKSFLAEHMDTYFEEFLKRLPDDETDLYMVVDSIKRVLVGLIGEDMEMEDCANLATEIVSFRKWYIHDLNVFNKLTGEECNVRDAIFDIVAAGFLNEAYSYDFRLALDYVIDGYDVAIADLMDEDDLEALQELDESEFEGFREFDPEEEENYSLD